ncbi:serine/threonine-protein phosphatase 7-like [Hibiscus syriacus]|uniref:Serine/threonine-protein phosphatase 7-like n=1 Tax=Hibiscus syriacus TaxID=106335 RepID=A0A6A2ZR05_HIBSY|nr:serine/threonine-protein phosphatase 7-like [Hibiscus syriacus]
MGRRLADSDVYRFTLAVLFLMAASSCFMSYYRFSLSFKGSSNAVSFGSTQTSRVNEEENVCCRGIEHLELWGDAVKWGSDFKLNSSKECCEACKEMCKSDDGPCLCDSWVFCGDKVACGSRFGECWLKKQNDILDPDRRDSGDMVMWTSGIIFGKGEGIVKLNTEYGGFHVKVVHLAPYPSRSVVTSSSDAIVSFSSVYTIHIIFFVVIHDFQLLPECAPYSVVYILELLSLHHCAGCQFYRAESRGNSWDPTGNHIEHASFGPPHALIQGTVEAQGTVFKDIPPEACPTIRGGSVAWVGSGPEFFISLAKHNEWRKAYTVFGYVLPEDMDIVEKISQLPTIPDVWSKVKVSVLERPVPLRILRTKKRP